MYEGNVKKEEKGTGSGGTEEEIFKKSRITIKSSDRKTETEREGVEECRREMGERYDRLEN